jgi:hypothetical protein
MAMNHDASDIYIEATRRLASRPVIRSHGGMETNSGSLGAKSTALVVLQHLVRFVRAAAEGDQFAEAKANVDKDDGNRRLKEENLDEFVAKVEGFLTSMAEAMGSKRFADTKHSIHLSGPGWGALGAVFYDLDATLGIHDLAAQARKLSEIDWARSAPYWADIIKEKENKKGEKVLAWSGGGYEVRQAIRTKMHKHLGTTPPSEVLPAGQSEQTAEPVAAAA